MSKEIPSKLRRRTLACENRLYDVYFDDLEETDGRRVENFLVVAPKEVRENVITGVCVLPVVDGRFALVRVFRHAVERFGWEVARGFIDQGEAPRDAALRELAEESGYACAPENLRFVGFVTPEPGLLAARHHLFAATRCEKIEGFEVSDLGHREVRLFGGNEVEELIAEGEIQDSNTIVVYYRYLALKGQDRRDYPQ